MSEAILFWDIDGTLLTTARAGVFALEEAATQVCGGRPDLADLKTSGLTDSEVATLAIEACGERATPSRVSAFLRSYERHLPDRLHWRRGHVMPGVVEALEHLAERPGVKCLLLTGNTRAGADAKLRHYGLAHYFAERLEVDFLAQVEGEGDGAFCADGDDRTVIARRAHALIRLHCDTSADSAMFVIGDTPHDVRCGRAIGARTIAVATGAHGADELASTGAWLVLDAIPPPPKFCDMLGISAAP